MSWADRAKEVLQRGERTVVYSKFDSIQDRISAGDAVHLRPVRKKVPKLDDLVLVNIQGRDYFGEVAEIQRGKYLVGNKLNKKLFWVADNNIFGIVTSVEKK
jgi:hypothetical protein